MLDKLCLFNTKTWCFFSLLRVIFQWKIDYFRNSFQNRFWKEFWKEKQNKKKDAADRRSHQGAAPFFCIIYLNYWLSVNKIKINLDKSNLNAIVYILMNFEIPVEASNFAFKALLSICEDVCIKLEKKAITERKNTKNFNISLKYFEAFALENVLRLFLDQNNEEHYILNSARLVANQINAKL